MGTELENKLNTREARKDFQRGLTLMEITEMACKAMAEMGISRVDLAERLGVTKGAVSQMLNGERNLTVNSISDLLFELGLKLEAKCRRIDEAPYKNVCVGRIGFAPLPQQRPEIMISTSAPGRVAA